MTHQDRHIAIFASGSGSNAENIIRHINHTHHGCGLQVTLVVTNRPDAAVIQRAEALGVPVGVISKTDINTPETILPLLAQYNIDIIVLAGFLLMVPPYIISRYAGHIINIHPSLLPRHGGHGMYGRHVHQAVVDAGDRQTGITIHHVSEEYDRGAIIFQAAVDVEPTDSPADVERKVRHLEQQHLPNVILSTFLPS